MERARKALMTMWLWRADRSRPASMKNVLIFIGKKTLYVLELRVLWYYFHGLMVICVIRSFKSAIIRVERCGLETLFEKLY